MPQICSLQLLTKEESLFFISLAVAVSKEQTFPVSPQAHCAFRPCAYQECPRALDAPAPSPSQDTLQPGT